MSNPTDKTAEKFLKEKGFKIGYDPRTNYRVEISMTTLVRLLNNYIKYKMPSDEKIEDERRDWLRIATEKEVNDGNAGFLQAIQWIKQLLLL